MARDGGKRGGKKGASRGGGRKPAPGWLWLVTGLTVGLFIAFLVFLSQQGRVPAPATAAREVKPAGAEKEKKPAPPEPVAQGKPAEAAKPPEKKPINYDFYTRLPEFEVEVPEDKGASRPRPVASPGSYVLQAGSFKAAKDAEARKAELALLGVRSSVQSVTVDGKATYHRVRIGPYRDLDRLNQVRQTLRENHIDFVTLRERS